LTITGALLSTFLITLGVLLATFAWAGYFGPHLALEGPKAAGLTSASDAHILIAAARTRTRFVVASEAASARGPATVPADERSAAQASLKTAQKKQLAARERRAQVQQTARTQAASASWSWDSWFK
jgi:hypothetical protein